MPAGNFPLLLKAAEAAGADADDALLGALADCLDETGDPADAELAALLRVRGHVWKWASKFDRGYGWFCRGCDAAGGDGVGPTPPSSGGDCAKGREAAVQEVRRRAAAERKELQIILAAERRAAYLKAKYGET